MRLIKRIIIIILLIGFIPVANQVTGEDYNRLTDIELIARKKYSRVVLHLVRKTPYRVIPNIPEKTLTIEIPRSLLNLSHPVPKLKDSIVEGVILKASSSGAVYADIKLRLSKVDFNHFLYRNPPRIVVNIRKVKGVVAKKSTYKKKPGITRNASPLKKKNISVAVEKKDKGASTEGNELTVKGSSAVNTPKTPIEKGNPATMKEKPVLREKEEKKPSNENESLDSPSTSTNPESNPDTSNERDESSIKDEKPNSQKTILSNCKESYDYPESTLTGESEDTNIFRTGLKLYGEERHLEALANFKSLVKGFPQSKYAEDGSFLIGDCFFNIAQKNKSDKYHPAIKSYKSALRLYPDSKRSPWAAFQIGESYSRMDISYEAEAGFSVLIGKYPGSKYTPEARLKMAESMAGNGKLKEARREFKRFLKDYPESDLSKRAIFGIADVYFRGGKLKAAQKHYEKALNRWPDYPDTHPEVLFNIGDIHFRNKEYDKSKNVLIKFVNLFPGNDLRCKALIRIGDNLRARGANEETLMFYAQAISQYPQDSETWAARMIMADTGVEKPGLLLPHIIFDYSSYTKPLSVYKEISRRFQNSQLGDVALLKEGLLLLKHGRETEAITAFKTLVRSSPGNPLSQKAHHHIQSAAIKAIDTNYQKNNYLSVLKNYLENVDPYLKNIRNTNILFQVGDSYQKLGLYDDAQKFYTMALQADKKTKQADLITFRIGKMRLMQGNYEKAEKIFAGFLKRFPKSAYLPDVLYLRGDIYYKKGDYREAMDVLVSALKVAKRRSVEARIYYLLADSFDKLGLHSKAIEAYRKALPPSGNDTKEVGSVDDFVLESHLRIGDSLYNKHSYPQALNAYMKANSIPTKDGRSKWASFRIADCYHKMAEKKKAVKTLQGIADDSGEVFWSKLAKHTIDNLNWEVKHKDQL